MYSSSSIRKFAPIKRHFGKVNLYVLIVFAVSLFSVNVTVVLEQLLAKNEEILSLQRKYITELEVKVARLEGKDS